MKEYIVSARKYRPQSFDTVVGQPALTTTLKNAISSRKLAHAYLFCGPRGVGKTTCARIFAKNINCLHPKADGTACEECESCRAFNEQRSFTIHELDAASNNSVDDIRALIDQVQVPPQIGRYKVYIIDEVHMLSQAAANAFLKTLEEPPAHAIFILATTEKQKILATILSRCQIYDFARMSVADIVNHLAYVAQQEGFTYEREALHVIAEKADGGMRDALSIFDQVASFCEGNITYEKVLKDLNVLDFEEYVSMTDELLAGQIPQALLRLNRILAKGFEGNYFIGGLAQHFRNLLMSRDQATLPLLDVSETMRAKYREQAERCNPDFLFKALRECNSCDLSYRAARNKRLLVELTLIEVAQKNSCKASKEDESPRGPSTTASSATQPSGANSDAHAPHKVSNSPNSQPKSQITVTQGQKPQAPTSPTTSKPEANNPHPLTSQTKGIQTSSTGKSPEPKAAPDKTSTRSSSSGDYQKGPALSINALRQAYTTQTATVTQVTEKATAYTQGPTLRERREENSNPLYDAKPQQPKSTQTTSSTQNSYKASPNSSSLESSSATTDVAGENRPTEITPAAASVEKEPENGRLLSAWYAFALRLPNEHAATAGRMKNMQPKFTEANLVEVSFENQIVENYMRPLHDQILQFLRHELNQPALQLKFSIVDPQMRAKPLSRKAQFNQIVKSSQALANLVESLQLELL